MRYSTDIRVDKLIVHILDPSKSDGLVLSTRDIPLEENPHLAEYFAAHIQNSLKDSATKAARFVYIDDDAVSGICKSLLAESIDLIQGSSILAKQLHAIISADRRTSACDLAVCFYSAGNQPKVPKYLALLKIDPSEVLRHKMDHDLQGNQFVNLEVESNVLPTTREKLQKCAFIQSLEPRHNEYDMMLLDRQMRKPFARFFIKDFLNAEFSLDSRERTDRLYTCLISAQNSLRNELNPQENESLRQAVDYAISSSSINIDTWIESLPISTEQKALIDEIVSEDLLDREFEIDTTYAQKLLLKKRFQGDHGLKVEVFAEDYDQVIRSVELIEEPGAPSYHRIVIHTEKWDDIRR